MSQRYEEFTQEEYTPNSRRERLLKVQMTVENRGRTITITPLQILSNPKRVLRTEPANRVCSYL